MPEPINDAESRDRELREVVYSPDSRLARPGAAFRAALDELSHSLYLGWQFAKRDIKAQYRQTVLGFFWIIFPTLLSTAMFLFLRRSGLLSTAETPIPYPVFVIVGSLFWQGFVDSVSQPIKAIATARSVLTKVQFPREALIVSAVLQTILDFLIRLALASAIVFFFIDDLPWTVFLAPLVGLLLVAFGTCIGLFISPLNLVYQDFQYGLGAVMTFWMFLSPVGFQRPETGMLATIMDWNPVTPLLNAIRDLMTRGAFDDVAGLVYVLALTLAMALVGFVLYWAVMPIVAERQSS